MTVCVYERRYDLLAVKEENEEIPQSTPSSEEEGAKRRRKEYRQKIHKNK